VAGAVTYVPGPGPYATFEDDQEAGMRMLAVAPEWRRRGVGRALVEACIARARSEGRTRLSLHTMPTMTAAHELYQTLGFRRAPENDRWVSADVPILGYALDL
jgi:ribosomal protein S18 acetylase RimI-like enzyme